MSSFEIPPLDDHNRILLKPLPEYSSEYRGDFIHACYIHVCLFYGGLRKFNSATKSNTALSCFATPPPPPPAITAIDLTLLRHCTISTNYLASYNRIITGNCSWYCIYASFTLGLCCSEQVYHHTR